MDRRKIARNAGGISLKSSHQEDPASYLSEQ